MGIIILYYKYINIQYPKRLQKWQEKICVELNLTGRIIIAHEGINGTLGGSTDSIERYKRIMHEHELFTDLQFKESPGNRDCFPRLQIKVKPEIVHLGIDPLTLPAQAGGIHLTPAQTYTLLSNKPDNLVILDARNNYESEVGAFKGALKPTIKYFRELPHYIDSKLEQFKDKDVLMYCTGGVRCERASAYLKSKNVARTVYQIEGGIHTYIQAYPDGFFEGSNYVFDNRLGLKANNAVLGNCYICTKPYDEYANCLHAACNKHFICCAECRITLKETCSTQCADLVYNQNAPKRPPFIAVKVNL